MSVERCHLTDKQLLALGRWVDRGITQADIDRDGLTTTGVAVTATAALGFKVTTNKIGEVFESLGLVTGRAKAIRENREAGLAGVFTELAELRDRTAELERRVAELEQQRDPARSPVVVNHTPIPQPSLG